MGLELESQGWKRIERVLFSKAPSTENKYEPLVFLEATTYDGVDLTLGTTGRVGELKLLLSLGDAPSTEDSSALADMDECFFRDHAANKQKLLAALDPPKFCRQTVHTSWRSSEQVVRFVFVVGVQYGSETLIARLAKL